MKRWKMWSLGVAAVALVAGVAWASGDWNGAREAAEKLKERQIKLRVLAKEEQQKIVTAICSADRKDRERAGKDAADRVSRTVTSEVGELRDMRDFAYRLIDDVIADDTLKDRRDDAKKLREEVEKRWDSIFNMVLNAMKGGNHPVVAYLIQQGQEAHASYQRGCDVAEFPTGSRIADCIQATGEECMVIELKPNNSRGIDDGEDQLKDQLRDLNDGLKDPNSAVIKNLISKKADFAKCKKFIGRIDCYTLCPVLSEKGEYQEARPDWKKDCS